MEQIIGWITELNRSDHTAFAAVTVLTMAGLGGFIASVIELFFVLVGIRTARSPRYRGGTETTRESNPFQEKEV
jgi:hypothetical protein